MSQTTEAERITVKHDAPSCLWAYARPDLIHPGKTTQQNETHHVHHRCWRAGDPPVSPSETRASVGGVVSISFASCSPDLRCHTPRLLNKRLDRYNVADECDTCPKARTAKDSEQVHRLRSPVEGERDVIADTGDPSGVISGAGRRQCFEQVREGGPLHVHENKLLAAHKAAALLLRCREPTLHWLWRVRLRRWVRRDLNYSGLSNLDIFRLGGRSICVLALPQRRRRVNRSLGAGDLLVIKPVAPRGSPRLAAFDPHPCDKLTPMQPSQQLPHCPLRAVECDG